MALLKKKKSERMVLGRQVIIRTTEFSQKAVRGSLVYTNITYQLEEGRKLFKSNIEQLVICKKEGGNPNAGATDESERAGRGVCTPCLWGSPIMGRWLGDVGWPSKAFSFKIRDSAKPE